MAWAGKASSKQKTKASILSRTAKKPLPQKDDPRGVPRDIMKKLSQLGLSNDPQAFNLKLQQLLKEAENG
jgi:hypothetical protein